MRELVPYDNHSHPVKVWYTTLELAELGLSGLPGTRRGIQEKATRENWGSRPRQGSGGGREYHVSNLSPKAREVLLLDALTARQDRHPLDPIWSTHPLDALVASGEINRFSDWQRAVMEARAQILDWIDERLAAFKKKEVIEALLRLIVNVQLKLTLYFHLKLTHRFCMQAPGRSALQLQDRPGAFSDQD